MKELIEEIKGTAFVFLVDEMWLAHFWCWTAIPSMQWLFN